MSNLLLLALVALGCGGGAPRPGKVVKKVGKEVKGAVQEVAKEAKKVIQDEGGDPKGTIRVELDTPKGKRFAYVHVPKGLDPTKPAPLIFAFHGGTGSSTAAKGYSKIWRGQFDKEAILVFPNGQDTNPDESAWVSKDFQDRSDVDIVLQILEEAKKTWNIDENRVYSAGFSNGGLMTTMLACHAPETFAGFAVFSNTVHKHTADACKPSVHKPLLYVIGTADDFWDGRTFSLSAMDSLEWWRGQLGCTKPTKTDVPDGPEDNMSVERWTFAPCSSAAALEFLKIEGGHHIWPGTGLPERNNPRCTDIDGSTEAVRFFTKYAGL